MRHLGDITNIDWFCVEPADVVTGGSPCQDLSIAGKRAGLDGARSGLFIEQIRCVKELRKADEARGRTSHMVRPRFMVWENVPGAFSSNKGEDFRAVLEETISIAEPEAPAVSVPAKGWPTSGCLYDDVGRWSVAWRVHDAQFWGVPQRRRRIALVADFGGFAAPEVLFERKGMCGDSGEGRQTQEAASERTGNGAYPAIARGLTARHDGSPCIDRGPNIVYDARGNGDGKTICTLTGDHQNRVTDYTAIVVGFKGFGDYSVTDIGKSLMACDDVTTGDLIIEQGNKNDKTATRDSVLRILQEAYGKENVLKWGVAVLDALQQAEILRQGMHEGGFYGKAKNRNELDDNSLPCPKFVAKWLLRDMWKQSEGRCSSQRLQPIEQHIGESTEVVQELPYQNPQAAQDLFDMWSAGKGLWLLREALSKIQKVRESANGENQSAYRHQTIRRLTPLEAERLQGYPDGYTDIGDYTDTKGKSRQTSDSARYRALGNSIALPFWKWLLKRISAQYERDATLGSLFDGIGGFPYLWEQINGKGSALWASEVEEFCIAVTKRRLGG